VVDKTQKYGGNAEVNPKDSRDNWKIRLSASHGHIFHYQ
jgi:hypothetical protein